VFDSHLLSRVELATARPRQLANSLNINSQEFESLVVDPDLFSVVDPVVHAPGEAGYASYQLIRNVLAAYATECSFCVLHDGRSQICARSGFVL